MFEQLLYSEPAPLFDVSAPLQICFTYIQLFSQQMFCLESKLKGMMGTAPCSPHMHDVIVMGGGVHKDHRYRFMFYPRNINSSLYAYFVREERWAKMPDLPYGISKPLMAITEDGQLLVIDSTVQEDSEKQKQLLCYCPQENTWTSSKVTDLCCAAFIKVCICFCKPRGKCFRFVFSCQRLPCKPVRIYTPLAVLHLIKNFFISLPL